MCNDRTAEQNEAWLKRKGLLSRRDFAKIGLGASFVSMLPAMADPLGVTETDVIITTPDGEADCYFVHPSEGAHAAVIIWPDITGLRPALRMMGKRLAQSGYAVLVVNPYYRSVTAPIVVPGETFADPAVRERVVPYYRTLTPETNITDAHAFATWLDAQDVVSTSRPMGTMGYCMGGPMTFRTAATLPGRIGAGASFHGGGLVTDAENSPHTLIPEMNAAFLVAIAENDDEEQPEAKTVLDETFSDNMIFAEVEVYADAMHGWCPPDSLVYNEEQAEHAWSRLLVLFDRHLA
ncbi:dienelactone hydrolase family protein [Ponticaulis sp.]|uniref:dienelactone hydrolase family protein n=1 Tax=Ponticaulis sp. TaxID=2020902 RepID=UPI000B6F4BA1|nr:dienelactone hydrolase family protein [Ponticaulis sp.]MAI90917.1 dienelactone hydrolase [Ponticaulis sp.]OUX98261.1 MAG: dienelactone hydrolase [Hyphomonadaceae bacterium TMED5]|tara:strand:+ start:22848 stop:23726 length:879 start_codon:yes stop_codon:yes gene_type:complete